MDVITQDAAIDTDALGPRDRTRFFRVARHDALDCLAASFVSHRYAPHSHDTYALGVITGGCEVYRLRGVDQRASAGGFVFVNPGEVHDGAPADGGYAYRMTYPSEALLREIACEASGRSDVPAPFFREAMARDPEAVAVFLRAHRALEEATDPLAADEAMIAAYALMIERHGDGRAAAPLGHEGGPVSRARELLDDRAADQVTLQELADVAGLSRRHLLRAFARETGLTPHAYQTDARVRMARRLLRAGDAPADVAAQCGFCDQSHLNRAFKARLGVAPGAFRAATAVSSKTGLPRAA